MQDLRTIVQANQRAADNQGYFVPREARLAWELGYGDYEKLPQDFQDILRVCARRLDAVEERCAYLTDKVRRLETAAEAPPANTVSSHNND